MTKVSLKPDQMGGKKNTALKHCRNWMKIGQMFIKAVNMEV